MLKIWYSSVKCAKYNNNIIQNETLNMKLVFKLYQNTHFHSGLLKMILALGLSLKIIFLTTLSISYAEDQKNIGQQSEKLLDYSEKVINDDTASEYSLRLTRSSLVKLRSKLLENEESQLALVKNLTSQIKAIDLPALDGEIGSEQLELLKDNLKSDLAKASYPLAFSRSARERADQLIDQIDELLLESFKSRLVYKGPSPLNVLTWNSTLSELSSIGSEILDQFNNSAENIGREAPIRILESLFLLAIGFGLFWLKPIFKSGIKSWTDVATRKNVQAIFLILENLNQLILPVAGYFAICNGLKGMNIFGIYSELFFDFALRIVLSIVIARWLILSIASPTIQIGHLLNFPKDKEKNIINVVIQLAVVFSAILFVDMLHKGFNLNLNSLVNLSFPIVLLNAFTLFKLSKAIRNAENYPTLVEKSAFFSKVISRLFLAIIILIPIITMFGYLEAALYFLKGIILSLAVIGGTYVAFHILDTFIKGALSFLKDEESQDDTGAIEKLLSSFIGLIIILISLMVISLVWGLAVNNLQDFWFKINEGIPFGAGRVTPLNFAKFLVIFSLGYLLTRFLQRLLKERILPSTNLDVGGKGAILSGLGYTGYFLAGILALSSTGLDLSSLAILAGALSVGLGFGMQTIVSNFVSGIIMLIERPIKEGDWIEVSGYSGTVKKISVRSTHLQTFNKATAIIPNSAIISSSVLNWMHGDIEGRVSVPIEVAYGTDPTLVRKLLLEIAQENPKVLDDPEPVVLLRGFGESALKFELRAFITEKFSLNVQSELNFEVLKIFNEHNIEIPYPKRDLNINIDPEGPMYSLISGNKK